MVDKEAVKKNLAKVLDPELGIDIVSLGLIYEVTFPEERKVHIKMTLTIPGCPMASYLTKEAQKVVEEMDEVDEADVELVFDPPWSPDMIPEETKKKLGLDK